MLRVLQALLMVLTCSCGPGTSQTEPQGSRAALAAPELENATAGQILEAVQASDAPVSLVNVWATWCIPCREEFPDLVRLYRDYQDRGLNLVFVSADFDDQIDDARAFLAEQGVNFTTYFKQQDDMEFIDTLSPDWSGALPASFIYDRGGRLQFFRQGKATYAMLEHEVLEVLNQDPPDPNPEETR